MARPTIIKEKEYVTYKTSKNGKVTPVVHHTELRFDGHFYSVVDDGTEVYNTATELFAIQRFNAI